MELPQGRLTSPQAIVYADIGEVRMETRTAECNRLLAQGWVLLGVYPLTTLGDMTEKGSENKHQEGQSASGGSGA
jgi:hypothetical protein